MVFCHRMHGLTLGLPFLCEELGAAVSGCTPDVVVEAGEVPVHIEDAVYADKIHELSKTVRLYRGGRRGGRFLTVDGKTITFFRRADYLEGLFRHHLLYPVMAGMLWMRGYVVLHASAVTAPQGVVLVTGESGAGKSTTVARLVAEGWSLLADDVSALAAGASEVLEVLPGGQHIHLQEDAGQRLGCNMEGLERREFQRMKVAVPVAVPEVRCAAAVSMIVYLHHADRLAVTPVRGRNKVPLLLEAFYGPALPESVSERHEMLGNAVRQIEMISIGRPADSWTVEDIVKAIRHG